MRRTFGQALLLLLAIGCGRSPEAPASHPYAWEVVKPGSCQGVSFALSEGRAAGGPMPMSGAGGPPTPPPPTLVFRLNLPKPRAEAEIGGAKAYLVREDGADIPLTVRGGSLDMKAVEIDFLAEHPLQQQTADVKVVLPNGDTTVFRLHLPPRDLTEPPAGGTTSVQSGPMSITGDAWSEPVQKPGEVPLVAATLTIKGLATTNAAWTIESPWIYLPDRQREPHSFRERMLTDVGADGMWSIGQAWTGPWAMDPPLVRIKGNLVGWKTFTEVIDLGELPVKIERIVGNDTMNPFTLAKEPLEVTTPSGLKFTLRSAKVGTIDYVESRPGITKLALDVVAEHSLMTGIPPEAKGSGTPILELRNATPDAEDAFHPLRFNLEGETVTYIGAKLPGPNNTLHVVLEVRRRTRAGETPFDLRLPVRLRGRTALSEHREPSPTGAIQAFQFDPNTIQRAHPTGGSKSK